LLNLKEKGNFERPGHHKDGNIEMNSKCNICVGELQLTSFEDFTWTSCRFGSYKQLQI